MQIIAGLIVGTFAGPDGQSPPEAYRLMFGFMMAISAIVLLIYSRVRDIRPSTQRAAQAGATKDPRA